MGCLSFYSKIFLLIRTTNPLKLPDLKTVRETLSESIHINVFLEKDAIFNKQLLNGSVLLPKLKLHMWVSCRSTGKKSKLNSTN